MLVSLVVVPWLVVQGWYALQFVPVATGFESREAFCRDKVALHRDYQKLDRLLPPDVGLYFPCRADSAAYAPRPVYFHPADAPPGKRLFLMRMGDRPTALAPDDPGPLAARADNCPGAGSSGEAVTAAGEAPEGFSLGRTVYENPDAVVGVFRTPLRPPSIGVLRVVELLPAPRAR